MRRGDDEIVVRVPRVATRQQPFRVVDAQGTPIAGAFLSGVELAKPTDSDGRGAALVAGRTNLLSPAGRLPALTLLGVAQGAHWLLFFEAVDRGSVAFAVLTFYAAPLLIALVAPLALPERLSATVVMV